MACEWDNKTILGLGCVGTDEPKSRQESEVPTEDGEEGEAMDDTNQDDEAMMAMMGLSGFGTTKVCPFVSPLVQLSKEINQLRVNASRAIKRVRQTSRRYGHGANT